MRKLLLIESSPGSLRSCADLLDADPSIELQRAPLSSAGAALRAPELRLAILDPGQSTPDDLHGSDPLGPPSFEWVVVVGGPRLEPAWVHRWLQAGAYEVLASPIDAQDLDRTLSRAWLQLHRPRQASRPPIPSPQLDSRVGFHRLLSQSAVYRRMLDRARACAVDDTPVLIWGEPGTGKNTLAECIHQASSRGNRALVRVTAPELADLLANPAAGESELGPHQPPRLLRERLNVAQGGTLLIGRLEELSAPAQARLMRTLLRPVSKGEASPIPLGLRVVASVRRSLAADVRRGAYRADLYHHLGLEVLHVPPLRERREDIELLAMHALRTWSSARPVESIASDTMRRLRSYDYPSNVSELETIMELALRAERSATLTEASLPSHLRQDTEAEAPSRPTPTWRSLEEVEVDYTRQVLEHTRGNRSEAARILGISRTGLLCKIRRYGINSPPREEGGRHER